jgi:signal transduction histidine kinase
MTYGRAYASSTTGIAAMSERGSPCHRPHSHRDGEAKNGELFPIELSVTEIEVDQEVHYAVHSRHFEKTGCSATSESERLAPLERLRLNGHDSPIRSTACPDDSTSGAASQQAAQSADRQAAATVQRLKNEISRLNQLAGQFRTISRRERYDFQLTSSAGLIDEVIRIQKPHFAQLNIEIDSLYLTDLPAVAVDKDKIKQALLNLVKNAAEAMPGGGKINIEARATETGVLIEITDTGMGIPLDIDAFEPFMTTKKEGTGIGLVIVRQIVTAHGGNISYRTRPGEGTTFHLELPRN